MIILEEDVFLMKPISIIENDFGVAIVKNRNYFPHRIIKFIEDLKGNTNTIGYGACGGAIINAEIFIKGFDTAITYLEQEFDNIYQKALRYVRKKTNNQVNFPDICPYSLEELLDPNWLPPYE